MIDQPISQFMNRHVLQGDAETPSREVVRQMHEHVQSAFAVCEQGQPVGIISERDTTTDTKNHLSGIINLIELHAVCRRYGNCYSILLSDIDHFKLYTDTFGHLQGDEALRSIAETMCNAVRFPDFVDRYVGEDF